MKSAIYTRNGDAGMTGLATGEPVCKDDVRLDAYGTIDEANAHLGLAIAGVKDVRLSEILTFLSHRLYNCSSNLAFGVTQREDIPSVSAADVAVLEAAIDVLEGESGPIGGFILCGAGEIAARLHITRAVVRRAERLVCRLFAEEPGDPNLRQFLNRASDLLFACARYASRDTGDTMWDADFPPPQL